MPITITVRGEELKPQAEEPAPVRRPLPPLTKKPKLAVEPASVPTKDFDVPIAADLLDDGTAMAIDEAVDAIFVEKGWPLLGGPSGRGWSHFSVAQRCARLFQATYDSQGDGNAHRKTLGGVVPAPLQIGALFHTLEALYYGVALGDNALVMPDRKGLCAPAFRGPGRSKLWPSNPNAADELLVALKAMCGVSDTALEEQLKASVGQTPLPEAPARAPSLSVILEAERLFDAHTRHWGKVEDVTPLAIEWFAADEQLGYTCRYDAIMRVGDKDPIIPPGVYIFERKTAKWLDESYLESWTIDGEILGQIHCWHHSDCERRFGKLDGVVMDVVSKGKIPECRRIVIPPDIPMAQAHARWIEMTKASISLWRALRVYPQSFANCFGRYGRCSQWSNCALGLEPGKEE